jgi:serine/threonine protein kinase
MAPESIGGQKYSKQSDMWTFGIVGTCKHQNSTIFQKLHIQSFLKTDCRHDEVSIHKTFETEMIN